MSFLRWNIDARSSRLGYLASLDGTLVFPLFAPRLGVDFRLGHGINIDIAATAAAFGLARAAAFLGFGIATDEVLEAMGAAWDHSHRSSAARCAVSVEIGRAPRAGGGGGVRRFRSPARCARFRACGPERRRG